MEKTHISLMVIVIFITLSCTRKKEDQTVFTTQMQYDVVIKNPDTIQDFRHRFMDDSTRFLFLKKIIDPILAGEITVYFWKNSRLVPESVPEFKNRFILNRSKSPDDSVNPNNIQLALNELTKIRYYEEWRLQEKSLIIDKRILAMILIHDSYTDDGEFRGTEPLIYIFYDKAFIGRYEEMCQQ